MQFQWPGMLYWLLLVPVFVILYILAQRRRQRYALRYASLSLVREALGRGPGLRRHIPPLLYLIGLALMLFALSRPLALVTVPTQEGTVILAIDDSGSMAADDIKPTRMEAARAAALAFVDKQNATTRIGVVSFSDNAAVVQAPTDDKAAVIAAINRLTPQRGTAVGRGILSSLDAIEEDGDAQTPGGRLADLLRTPTPAAGRIAPAAPTHTPFPKGLYAAAIVVLLTDGENNIWPAPLDIINQAVDAGVRVYTVGVGSTQGSVLHLEGMSVRSRLDEATLKKIAETTGGQYFNAANETDLKAIYEKLTPQFVMRTQKTEITALLTAAAGLISLVGGILSLVWFNRLP